MLNTVQDYVNRARTLLLDEVEPYRYSTESLIYNLNMGLLEMRRIRPELLRPYYGSDVPQYNLGNLASTVPLNQQYRVSLVYFIVGQAQLRDEENTQDSRAAALLNTFKVQLLSVQQ